MLKRAIRNETALKIWNSYRFSHRQEMEDIVGKFAFTLRPFTSESQNQILEKYWSKNIEISN